MGKKAVHFIAAGRVQGVGFRFFVREQAVMLSLSGWVRNCSDGSVEGEVYGEAAAIELFVQQLQQGPRMAEVASLILEPIEFSRETAGFHIFR